MAASVGGGGVSPSAYIQPRFLTFDTHRPIAHQACKEYLQTRYQCTNMQTAAIPVDSPQHRKVSLGFRATFVLVWWWWGRELRRFTSSPAVVLPFRTRPFGRRKYEAKCRSHLRGSRVACLCRLRAWQWRCRRELLTKLNKPRVSIPRSVATVAGVTVRRQSAPATI